MSELNKIVEKINKINEFKLSKVSVELALADQLKKAIKEYKDGISKYGKELDAYYVPIRQLEKIISEAKSYSGSAAKIAQELRKLEDNVSGEIDKVNKKIQEAKAELGVSIDINDIADLSSLQGSNKVSSGIQDDAAKLVKYLSSLEKPNI